MDWDLPKQNTAQIGVCVCVCVCVLSCFSHIRFFVTLWIVACPWDSSVLGIFQARILEWVARPFSRGSSWPRDQTWVLCLLHWQGGCLSLMPPGNDINDQLACKTQKRKKTIREREIRQKKKRRRRRRRRRKCFPLGTRKISGEKETNQYIISTNAPVALCTWFLSVPISTFR